jgi:hypothetical protein
VPTKLRYVRVEDHLEDAATVVVRGGLLDQRVVRRDALRMHQVYGVYGISVFAVRDISLDELAQQLPLVRFPVLTLVTVGAIRSAGAWIDPTGRNRLHYTVWFGDLDEGVGRLCSVKHEIRKNPYHEQ